MSFKLQPIRPLHLQYILSCLLCDSKLLCGGYYIPIQLLDQETGEPDRWNPLTTFPCCKACCESVQSGQEFVVGTTLKWHVRAYDWDDPRVTSLRKHFAL